MSSSDKGGLQSLPLSVLQSNPSQPRQTWDESTDDEDKDKLERLAQSIKAEGILQPLLVTPNGQNGHYVIVCGERRYRAAKLAKLGEVPCIVRPGLDAKQVLELSIVENVQRENLTPVDEAKALRALIEQCGYTQAEVGKRLGMSASAVNIKLSLLALSPKLQKDVRKGELTETQGREIAREVNKLPDTQRTEAQADIRKRLEELRMAKGNGRLSTKDVRSAAKATVDEVKETPPQPASKPGEKAKPKPAPKPAPKPEPATAKEKSSAKKFAALLASVKKQTTAFGTQPFAKETGVRFCQVLTATASAAGEDARSLHGYFSRVVEHLDEAKRRNLVSKS